MFMPHVDAFAMPTCYGHEATVFSRVNLSLQLVRGSLNRHPRAVEAEREESVLTFEALILHDKLALCRVGQREGVGEGRAGCTRDSRASE